MAEGQSPPQELEEGPRSVPHLLVSFTDVLLLIILSLGFLLLLHLALSLLLSPSVNEAPAQPPVPGRLCDILPWLHV